jgi:hypothetical protein
LKYIHILARQQQIRKVHKSSIRAKQQKLARDCNTTTTTPLTFWQKNMSNQLSQHIQKQPPTISLTNLFLSFLGSQLCNCCFFLCCFCYYQLHWCGSIITITIGTYLPTYLLTIDVGYFFVKYLFIYFRKMRFNVFKFNFSEF